MAKEKIESGLGKCSIKGCGALAEWRDIQNNEIVNVCRKHIKSSMQ